MSNRRLGKQSKDAAGTTGPASSSDRQAEADGLYTIGELARELGVTARAIRFYEAKGLIAPARVGRTRSYNRRDRARLMLILRGKRLGFSLGEIAEYLSLYDADPGQLAQIRHLLAKLDESIAELDQKRADIEHTLDELKEVRARAVKALRERGGDA